MTKQGKLDEAVTKEDQEILLQALKSWGALDGDYKYNANLISAEFRGYVRDPGGGLLADPLPSDPVGLSEILQVAGLALLCRISRDTISRPRCSSRSAAWT